MNPIPSPDQQRPPLQKQLKPWVWFGLLVAGVFIIICLGAFLADPQRRRWSLLPIALIWALGLAGFGVAAVRFFQWVFCWQNFRKFLFGLACFITVIALALLEENLRGKHAWMKHQRELEAQGEKLDLAALLPPEVPAERNFALMPLLKPLLEFTYTKEGIIWADTNANARLNEISASLFSHGSTNSDLAKGSVEKGTFANLAQWQAFYRGNTNYPQAPPAATPAETVLTALGKFEPEIKQLREAAVSRPYSRFPIQYGHQPSWEILLPHLAHLKGLAVLMNVRATAELEAGRSSEAFDDLKVAMRLSGSIRDEPILIDHLVRIAVLAVNLQTVREGLVRHAWNDAQLNEMEKYLAAIDLLAEYKLAMRGERALCVGGLDYLRRKGLKANPMYYLDENETGSTSPFAGLNLMPSGWFYQNMLTISRMHGQYALDAADETHHRIHPNISEQGARAIANLSRGPCTIFARMLLPALEKAIRKSAHMQTFVDATRAGCALERYRLINSHLPETLDALAPQFISAIPTDVIDGNPLRYRKTDKGYILYSVGWNQTDDGGQIVPRQEDVSREDKKNHGHDRPDEAKGDWVWFMQSE